MADATPLRDTDSRLSAGSTQQHTNSQGKQGPNGPLLAIAGGAIVLIAALALGIYALLQPGAHTEQIRDVFIIVVSFETLVIGIALIVLLVQLASLINLLQNEVRPILQATSETVNTLRGTADFLGESVIEPVIKLNTYLASIQRVLELMGIKHK